MAASRRFYELHLGFRAVFGATWYVHLVRETKAGAMVQLAVMDHAHETIPEGQSLLRQRTQARADARDGGGQHRCREGQGQDRGCQAPGHEDGQAPA